MDSDVDNALERSRRCYEAGDLDGSAEILEEAVKRHPDSFTAHYNLGVVHRDRQDWPMALERFNQAVVLGPPDPNAFNNLGLVHENLDDFAAALACFRAALSLQADLPIAHFNLSLLLLRIGRYREGFAEFEWRVHTDQVQGFECPHPRWDGSPIAGTLLVHTEQGAGDAIQFARFLPQVIERVGRVLFVCPDRLSRLFSSVPGIAEIRNAGTFEIHSFDTYISLLSIPHVLGLTPDSAPGGGAPYVKPPAEIVELPPAKQPSATLKVGISWAGSRTHIGDRNRSCKLQDFEPVFEVDDVAFYSLQVGESEELAAHDYDLVDLENLQGDWADAASLASQMDLVISVDTGVAHLAAAIGTPVWLALGKHCDWRWMTDRTDSPWYDCVRLFRQEKAGDWSAVFDEMRAALEDLRKAPQD